MSAAATRRTVRVPPYAASVLARLCEQGPVGLGASLEGLRLGRTLLQSLSGSAMSLGVPAAMASAFASACLEVPGMARWDRERWARVSAVWLGAGLVVEARLCVEGHRSNAAVLCALASTIARESDSFGESFSSWSGPAGTTDARGAALRRALAVAHEQSIADDESGFVQRALGALRRGLPVLSVGGASCEKLARGAIASSDRAAHADATSAWSTLPREVRVVDATRAMSLAALALAHESTRAEPDVALWLSRMASELAASTGALDEWLLPSASDAREGAAHTDGAHAAPPALTEFATHDRDRDPVDAHTEMAAMNTPQNPGNPAPARAKAVLETLETDATDAAWRTAGSQFVKLTREPLVGLLSRHLAPGDESARARIAAFLETEVGTALLAGVLSVALTALPRTTGAAPQRLARELRVRAMSDVTDQLADVLMGPLRQVIMLYLQDPGGAVAGAIAEASPAALAAPSNVVTAAFGDTTVRSETGTR